jgi:phosphoglycerate dehydrogenase-like enzyme
MMNMTIMQQLKIKALPLATGNNRMKTIKTVGVAGAGAMGRGIAQIAAQAGLRVRLFDTNVSRQRQPHATR